MNTQKLIKELKSRGMTQQRIASYAGCTQAAVSIWLSGKHEANLKYYLKLKELYDEKESVVGQ